MFLASMKLIYRLIFVLAASGFFPPLAHGQASLSKTTFGKSQNSPEDLVNSLTPGKPNLTKGEKKEEVDPKKLPSKSMKDPTFQGTLMDVDIDWTGNKLGKPHTASDANSKASKKEDAAGAKDPKAAKQEADTAGGEKDPKGSKAANAAGAGQNKDQKVTSAAADEKPSEKEKAAASKTDGDH
jgi:hypothetical protein